MFSLVKKSSGLNQERIVDRSNVIYTQKTDQYMWVNFDVRRQQRMNFHWRKRFYELQTNMQVGSGSLRLKTLMMVLLVTNMQHFASQDVNLWAGLEWITCGLLWCFYQMFGLSFWRHPFTAKDPLVSKWCNAGFLQIGWRNQLMYIWDYPRVSALID